VLTDPQSLDYLVPLAQMLVGVTRPLNSLLQAYRQGGGVAYAEYTDVFRQGQAGINRAMFLKLLGTEWFPSLPNIHSRLQADPPARVADIGCGAAWSSIAIAQSYAKVEVDGYDLDAPSVAMARHNVEDAGLNQRVHIYERDASDPTLNGRYDLVTAFECLHDMGDPVSALRTMRRLVNQDGIVLIADERVGDRFTPEGNDVEWMMYGWSVLHCLPVGMADGGEHHCGGTGTVMRSETLQLYAQAAGFRGVEILPIDHVFFRFYRLYP
jgi:SAM-dependent methyltransferase